MSFSWRPSFMSRGARNEFDLTCPTAEPLPHVPDDVTVGQFILDSSHPTRPVRGQGSPWLIDDETGKTVARCQLQSKTQGLANALTFKYNIHEDDVVVIFSPNHMDYPVSIWAVHRLGAIVSCANPTFTSDELVYQLETTKAVLVISHPACLDTTLKAARTAGLSIDRIVSFDGIAYSEVATVSKLIQEGLERDAVFTERRLDKGEAKTKIAFLSFSSGTTGRPKAVAIPHISLIANVIQMAVHNKVNQNYTDWERQRFRPGDVALGVLPFFHIYGLVLNLHFMLFCAMSVVVVPKFNFIQMLESINRHKITHLLLVPPQAVLLCKHEATRRHDLSGVRLAMFGAAPMSSELNQQLMKVLPNAHIGQGYGLTETSTTVSMMPISRLRGDINSCGQILPGIVCRVVREDGTFCKYGEPGELHVKSPSIALRYLNDEQATKETFIDGWVRTGDLVIIDKNGDLFVLDRLKEIMKVKGFQVAPAELEGCLYDHPDVADACVVGIPHQFSGEVPLAFVVLNPRAVKRLKDAPHLADEIKAGIVQHVAANKVAYKHLAGGVEFLDAIPKNPSGKLLRRLLREKAKDLRTKTRTKL